MQANLEPIQATIASATALITAQKNTIVDLKTRLSAVSSEYAASIEAEGIEDAETDSFLASLTEISEALEATIAENSDTEPVQP